MIRIVVVEDHHIVRAGLRMLIESRPGFRVVGEAADRAEALRVTKQEQPDIILFDIDLGGTNGLEFFPELLESAPQARPIILTGLQDLGPQREAIRLGARGIVHKREMPDEIFQAIETVHRGRVWFGDLHFPMPTKAPPDPEAGKIASLTERQREVIAQVSAGLSNREIANRLYITEATVRHHLTSIYEKLGVSGRFSLMVYADRHHFLQRPADL